MPIEYRDKTKPRARTTETVAELQDEEPKAPPPTREELEAIPDQIVEELLGLRTRTHSRPKLVQEVFASLKESQKVAGWHQIELFDLAVDVAEGVTSEAAAFQKR